MPSTSELYHIAENGLPAVQKKCSALLAYFSSGAIQSPPKHRPKTNRNPGKNQTKKQ